MVFGVICPEKTIDKHAYREEAREGDNRLILLNCSSAKDMLTVGIPHMDGLNHINSQT